MRSAYLRQEKKISGPASEDFANECCSEMRSDESRESEAWSSGASPFQVLVEPSFSDITFSPSAYHMESSAILRCPADAFLPSTLFSLGPNQTISIRRRSQISMTQRLLRLVSYSLQLSWQEYGRVSSFCGNRGGMMRSRLCLRYVTALLAKLSGV